MLLHELALLKLSGQYDDDEFVCMHMPSTREEAAIYLKELTGGDFGADYQRWRACLDGLGSEFLNELARDYHARAIAARRREID